jgi:type III restriction enzyme
MIRTPLARRIESDEALNVVELFLPHYDTENLESVLSALRNPEAHEGTGTTVTTQAVEYPRNPAFAEVFKHLATLKTYSVDRAPKMTDLKRALRLSGLLMQEGIAEDADEKMRLKLTDKLAELREAYAKKVKDWGNVIREGGEIEVDVTSVAIGPMSVTGHKTTRMLLSEENIDQLYDEAGRMLAAGEGLHRTYWKRFQDKTKPSETKLELAAILRQADTLPTLEKLAGTEFKKLWEAHKGAVAKLPASERARFQQLVLASGKAVEHEWELPERIVEKPGKHVWKDHLYATDNGEFAADLNGWEKAFMKWTQEQGDFVCWLRNLPRRDWAFCVPYEKGGEKPFYPDFVIVRKKGKGYVADILEPHDDSRLDTWAKVKGLAKFADEHEVSFGRLMLGRKVGDKLQVVDVADHKTREKARKMGAPADLEALFEECE